MRAVPWHLKLGRRTLARVVPAEVPGLYHQVRADGRLSRPANLSWAKNGALGAVLRNHPELEQLPVGEWPLRWRRETHDSLGNRGCISRSLAAGTFSGATPGAARARAEVKRAGGRP
jgi:hypothetical protein